MILTPQQTRALHTLVGEMSEVIMMTAGSTDWDAVKDLSCDLTFGEVLAWLRLLQSVTHPKGN